MLRGLEAFVECFRNVFFGIAGALLASLFCLFVHVVVNEFAYFGVCFAYCLSTFLTVCLRSRGFC